jgi:ribosomal protein S6E (S10)
MSDTPVEEREYVLIDRGYKGRNPRCLTERKEETVKGSMILYMFT